MRKWRRKTEDSNHRMKERQRKEEEDKREGREKVFTVPVYKPDQRVFKGKKRKKWKSSAIWRDERQGGSRAKSRK